MDINTPIDTIYFVAFRRDGEPWQIIGQAKSMPLAKGKVTELALDRPGIDFAVAKMNRFGDFMITDYQKRGWIERRNMPIGGAVSGLVNSNDDCLRG